MKKKQILPLIPPETGEIYRSICDDDFYSYDAKKTFNIQQGDLFVFLGRYPYEPESLTDCYHLYDLIRHCRYFWRYFPYSSFSNRKK